MKNAYGNTICAPEYTLIAKTIDYIFFLDPYGNYKKITEGCSQSGYMDEEDRPYVVGIGKVGFKENDRVVIPPVYDYVRHEFSKETFYAEKDGQFMFLNMEGNEILTNIRWFEGEDRHSSPFQLSTDDFDNFTSMKFVGKPIAENPNVIKVGNVWVELERFNKEEVMNMLINSSDDLALTQNNLSHLCSDFSYEYSLYFANANGECPLKECMTQFKKMYAFSNSWYYVVKLWQAPSEHVSARELREFRYALQKTRQLGNLVIAVGYDDNLKPGEVRMMLITHYHERCFPPYFEYEWTDKCNRLSIKELMEATPELKQTINNEIREQYREEVFLDQMRDVLANLRYDDSLSWSEVEPIMDFFYKQGSPCTHVVKIYLKNAESYVTQGGLSTNLATVELYLKAVLWAVKHGAVVNGVDKKRSSLDIIRYLARVPALSPIIETIREVESNLLERGAMTKAELVKEENTNTDYYKELDRMRLPGTSEKVMPVLCTPS